MHKNNEIVPSRRAIHTKKFTKPSTKQAFGIGSALGAAALSGLVLAGSAPAQAFEQHDPANISVMQEALPQNLDLSIFETPENLFERAEIKTTERFNEKTQDLTVAKEVVQETVLQPSLQENLTVKTNNTRPAASNNTYSNASTNQNNFASNSSCASGSCYGAQCFGSACTGGDCSSGNCVNGFCSGGNCSGNSKIQSNYGSYNCDGNTCYVGSCSGSVCGYGSCG